MSEFDASLLASTGRAATRASRSCRPPPIPDGEVVFQRWAAMGVAHFARPRRRGRAGARARPRRSRRSGGGPGRRRGRPHLPVRRQARAPARRPGRHGRRPGLARRARSRGDPGRLLGRGDGPRGARVRLPGQGCCRGRCAGARASGSRPGVSVIPHYDAWPEPFSALDRAPGAARLGRARASTRRPRSSDGTAAGRSTARRGSRSGAAATASVPRGEMFRV